MFFLKNKTQLKKITKAPALVGRHASDGPDLETRPAPVTLATRPLPQEKQSRGGRTAASLMSSPPPGPPAWSVTLSLKHRGGLEIRAAAENLLPGWGRGGERLSLLLRLRRRLLLSVTSQCGDRPAAATQPGTPPRGSRIVRFLRSRWARLPRVTSIWRRKKQPPARVAAAVPRDRRDQVTRSPFFFNHSLHQCIQFLIGLRLPGFLPACSGVER